MRSPQTLPAPNPKTGPVSRGSRAAPGLIILVLILLSLACASSSEPLPTPQPPDPTQPVPTLQATELAPSGRAQIQVFFTDPGSTDGYRGGHDEKLADAIALARVSVDVAAFDLNLWSIRDALLDAHRRGVQVRMVTDSDNLDEPEIQDLKDAGMPVVGDRREALMHNKFVVIDRQEVWTGSMNLTVNSAYRNNDNLLRLRSQPLAENYRAEFEEMFTDDQFGPGSPANTINPRLEIGSVVVENYFSPDDGVAAHLVALIENAQESIYILAYSFTSDELSQAIQERAAAGVNVAGVFEESQVESNSGGEFENFLKAGIDVRLDGNRNNMHHKIIIIDNEIVVTGSYNFSYNAENKNDENVLILFDPQLASLYAQEFARIFSAGHN
jgi:phosphatidylserine/phosphatidylglycerophosphate/cardiolipin synthase-like enzyme